MELQKITNHNKAIDFVLNRIEDPLYRGSKSSQHNRYDMNQFIKILELLNEYSPNMGLMTIRTTDISKRPINTPEEYLYASFCDKAKEIAGIGTQDAMRKNLFVDFHRMGFIERYDKNQNPIDIDEHKLVKYVSLTSQGLKLINAENLLSKYFIFSKGIDNLLGGYIDIVLSILMDKENGIDNISIYEYMLFISAINTETNFNISTEEAIELIKKYRLLTNIQRKGFIEYLKTELNPDNYKGNKTNKRDFHNRKNKIEQIFYLLNQTVYFEVRGEQLVLKDGPNSFNQTNRLDRSLNEKYLYFKNHKIDKELGFELHHVVPLSRSEDIHHFKILDKRENMVYIDAYSHAKISQNRNKNVIMKTEKDDIILSDFSQNEVYLSYEKNISYDPKNQNTMKTYNDDLLNTLK